MAGGYYLAKDLLYLPPLSEILMVTAMLRLFLAHP
jgi:hypothetical protein